MTRPRRGAHADPGSDPAWEWGARWACDCCPSTLDRDRTEILSYNGHTYATHPDFDCGAARAEITD